MTTIYAEGETCYWGEIESGTPIVVPRSRPPLPGEQEFTVVVIDPPGFGTGVSPIPLESIREGDEVFVGQPTSDLTMFSEIPYRRVRWHRDPSVVSDTDTVLSIRRERNALMRTQPVRGIVPINLMASDLVPGMPVPANAYLLVCRPGATSDDSPGIEVRMCWTNPDGQQRWAKGDYTQIPQGAKVHIRQDYVRQGPALTEADWAGATFIPTLWTSAVLYALAADMRRSVPWSTRDQVRLDTDRVIAGVNAVSTVVTGAIMAVDPDKRDVRHAGLFGWSAWAWRAKRKRVAELQASKDARVVR